MTFFFQAFAFALFGREILSCPQVQIAALEAAGGLLLLLAFAAQAP